MSQTRNIETMSEQQQKEYNELLKSEQLAKDAYYNFLAEAEDFVANVGDQYGLVLTLPSFEIPKPSKGRRDTGR